MNETPPDFAKVSCSKPESLLTTVCV